MRGVLPRAFVAALLVLVLLGAAQTSPPRVGPPGAPRATALSVIDRPGASAYSAPNPAVDHPASGGGGVSWGQVCTGLVSCSPGNPNVFTGAMASWDFADGYGILFGGRTSSGALYATTLNETLKFVTGTPHWSTIVANGGNGDPKQRTDAAITYDWRDGYVLMFGGTSTTAGTERSDTWSFHAGTWTQEPAAPAAMKATFGAGMAALPGSSGYVLYFGGCAGSVLTYYANTWEYVGGTWTNISSSAGTAPPRSCGGKLVYDSTDGYFVYFGGFTSSGPQNGTWEFNPGTSQWSQIFAPGAAGQPSPRGLSEMSCVAFAAACYLYSGASGTIASAVNLTGDLWKFSAGTWMNVTAIFPGIGPSTGWWSGATWNTSNAMYFEGGTTKTAGNTNATYAIGAIVTGISLQSNFGEVLNGSAIELYANVSGGVGPFTLTYANLPGCASSNTTALRCVTSQVGYFPTLEVAALDGGTGLATGENTIDFPLTVDPVSQAAVQLEINGYVRTQPGSFWGVNTQGGFGNSANASVLNESVFNTLRWGEGAGTNVTSCVSYSPNGVPSSCGENISTFVNWCELNHCSVELGIPIEQNNMGAITYEIEYIERNLGFYPSSWGLGNEPEGWTEYGIAPQNWHSTNDFTITASAWGQLVKNAVAAIRSVDTTTPIIGIEASGCGDGFEAATMNVDGPNVSIVACHAYAGGGQSTANPPHNLAEFLSLTATAGQIGRLGAFRTSLTAQDTLVATHCPSGYSCANVRERVNEFNSFLGNNYFSENFPEVDALAVEEYYMLLDKNVSGGDVFDFTGQGYGLFNVVPSQPTPAWYLYSTVLKNLTHGDIYNVTFTGPQRNLIGLETHNASTGGTSLLLVNDNSTVSFIVDTSNFYPGVQPRVYAFTSGMATPTVTVYPDSSFDRLVTLAPMEVLLVNFGNVSASTPNPIGQPAAAPPINSTISPAAVELLSAIGLVTLSVIFVMVAIMGRPKHGRSGRRRGR
ncbi:MAG: hypothetical protein L3K07_03870 [Thermoplasmata archaeon]|nr:hypothetical protein [Thermoplasmata archaeon]